MDDIEAAPREGEFRPVGPVDYTIRQVQMDERSIAHLHVTSAFYFAKRPMPPGLEVMIQVRIRDAYREGIRDAETLALRALEQEGFAVRWAVTGELGIIEFVETGTKGTDQ